MSDETYLQKYRFAFKTADYYLCRTCGAYLGAVLCDEEGCWSTVNLRLSELDVSEEPMHYGAEDGHARVARRKARWTPTTIVIGG